jgi:hypothetical protein
VDGVSLAQQTAMRSERYRQDGRKQPSYMRGKVLSVQSPERFKVYRLLGISVNAAVVLKADLSKGFPSRCVCLTIASYMA